MRTGKLDGVEYTYTQEQENARDAEEAVVLAGRDLSNWKASLQAIDNEGITRTIENIIDSMSAVQLGRLDSFTKEAHSRKKILRANKP